MSDDAPIFVVQLHDATALHYDVRLEIGGVLVSWAVPKGPSLDPRERRLAVRVGDHDLDHATFEGIGGGTRGSGAVVVWDTGTLHNETERDGSPVALPDALERGSLRVRLSGHKLAGAWSFTHARLGGEDRNWLMVKVDDDGADRRRRPTSTEPASVLSGRTLDEVIAGRPMTRDEASAMHGAHAIEEVPTDVAPTGTPTGTP